MNSRYIKPRYRRGKSPRFYTKEGRRHYHGIGVEDIVIFTKDDFEWLFCKPEVLTMSTLIRRNRALTTTGRSQFANTVIRTLMKL